MLIGKSTITLNQETMVTAVQAWVDAHWKGSHKVKVIKVEREKDNYAEPTHFKMEVESAPSSTTTGE